MTNQLLIVVAIFFSALGASAFDVGGVDFIYKQVLSEAQQQEFMDEIYEELEKECQVSQVTQPYAKGQIRHFVEQFVDGSSKLAGSMLSGVSSVSGSSMPAAYCVTVFMNRAADSHWEKFGPDPEDFGTQYYINKSLKHETRPSKRVKRILPNGQIEYTEFSNDEYENEVNYVFRYQEEPARRASI